MVMGGVEGGVTLNTSQGGMNCIENLGGRGGGRGWMGRKG